MRVHLKTKNKGVKHATYPCRKCADPIVAGEQYYEWQHRHAPPSRQHHKHGPPRQSELCTGKMSGVYAAVEGLEDAIAAGRKDNDPSSIASALTDAAEQVREVAQEYEDARSNMPDHLQDCGTGAEMQEKIDALESFAEELDSASGECETLNDEYNDLCTEEPNTMADHSDDCAVNSEPPADGEEDLECDCGYDEQESAYDQWESDKDEKLSECFDRAESAAGELSI